MDRPTFYRWLIIGTVALEAALVGNHLVCDATFGKNSSQQNIGRAIIWVLYLACIGWLLVRSNKPPQK